MFFNRNKFDLHIHTIASGHAYSTLEEITRAARKKGLKAIAITDHGPMMPGGAHEYYFWNQKIIPDYINGVRVLKGIEANIINKNGDLDLTGLIVEKLDLMIASCHIKASPEKLSKKDNTKMYLNALKNPKVTIIGHLENMSFPVDFEQVITAAKDAHKLIEINNASYTVSRKGSHSNCLEILEIIKKIGADTIINSDAHISSLVGEIDKAYQDTKKVGLKREQILNFYPNKLKEYIPTL